MRAPGLACAAIDERRTLAGGFRQGERRDTEGLGLHGTHSRPSR